MINNHNGLISSALLSYGENKIDSTTRLVGSWQSLSLNKGKYQVAKCTKMTVNSIWPCQ